MNNRRAKSKGFSIILIIAIGAIIATFGWVAYATWQQSVDDSNLTLTLPLLKHKAKNANTDNAANTNSAVNTNTNVSTADWKTYTNSTYHFSFQYPANWSITQAVHDYDAFLASAKFGQEGSLTVQPVTARGGGLPEDPLSTTKKPTTVGGKTATQYVSINTRTGKIWQIAIVLTPQPTGWGTTAQIILSPDASGLIALPNQILSTFAFDETVGWKTYENAQEQFSIRYPGDWTQVDLVSKSVDALTSIVALRSSEFQKVDNAVGEIYVNRFTNTQNLSLASYWNSVNDLGVSTTPVATTVNGYEAQRLDRLANPIRFSSPMTKVFIKGTGRIYDLSIANVNGNFEQQIGTFEKILSTFTISATLGWKTYTNAAYGYSLKYPIEYTATNEDLGSSVEKGQLNGDPYYRVGVAVYSAPITRGSSGSDIYTWAKNGFPKDSNIEKSHANPRQEKIGNITYTATDGDLGSTPIPEYLVFHDNKLYVLTDFRVVDKTVSTNRTIISTLAFPQ